MKSIKNFLYFFCIISISLTSCLSDECTEQRSYFRYDPVYMTASQFRVNVSTEPAKALENPGKMYFYKDFLFINQKGEGVHIYDNSDKNNPTFVTFYNIPGNFDIVIKDDLLVADNVIDLITIDISDIYNPLTINRIEDYKGDYSWVTNDNHTYHTYSIASPVKEIVDCSDTNFGFDNFWRGDVFFTLENSSVVLDANGSNNWSGSSVGIGGSTSRFTIKGDYLYTVSYSDLLSYEFKNGNAPIFKSSNNLGWNIETIYPYKDNLFIGSQSGMFIFGLTNPENPNKISTFEHARACDPVVVSGNTAFVTLRDGSECTGFLNQLDVIDISDLTNPTLIKSYSMKNPNGMAVNGDKLYLSESAFGIKVLDISDNSKVKELAWDKNKASSDLIYLGDNKLMSIGSDGFHQFDVSDDNTLKEISHIPVK